MFTACKLAQAGYFQGDPDKVLSSRVDIVQALLDYENFDAEFEKEYIALNKAE